MHTHHNHSHDDQHGWFTLLKEETLCHLPYALGSVIVGIIGVSLMTYVVPEVHLPALGHKLFHAFHYLHLVFAGTGVILSFRKYSSSVLQSLVIGFIVPTIFCTLSDAFIPYVAGSMLEVTMQFHWCFKDHFSTVIVFLGLGIANGWFLSVHAKSHRLYYLLGSHIFHIVISSMASILYLVTFGFSHIWGQIHLVFVFLFIAVLVPCTLSDVVVPVLFAARNRAKKKAGE